MVSREPAGAGQIRQLRRSRRARTRKVRCACSPFRRRNVCAAASNGSWMRMNSSAPSASARSARFTRRNRFNSAWPANTTRSDMSRAKATVGCSAATRTGAVRCGFRSTTSSSKPARTLSQLLRRFVQDRSPGGIGRELTLKRVADLISNRLISIFQKMPMATGPCFGGGIAKRYDDNPTWQNLVLFHEYFHAGNRRRTGRESSNWFGPRSSSASSVIGPRKLTGYYQT